VYRGVLKRKIIGFNMTIVMMIRLKSAEHLHDLLGSARVSEQACEQTEPVCAEGAGFQSTKILLSQIAATHLFRSSSKRGMMKRFWRFSRPVFRAAS
jgi:hypothetical protein